MSDHLLEKFLDNLREQGLTPEGLNGVLDEVDQRMIGHITEFPDIFMDLVRELEKFDIQYIAHQEDDDNKAIHEIDQVFALWCVNQPPGKLGTIIHTCATYLLRHLTLAALKYHEQNEKGISTSSQNQ